LGENDWVLKTRTVQGLRKLVDYPEVKEVAERLGASPAQVLIAWGASRGLSVVCKSVQKGRWTDRVTLYIIALLVILTLGSRADRIIKNFQQVALSKEDSEKLSGIAQNNHVRFNVPITYSPKWSINVFDEAIEKEGQTEYTVKLV
jgi:L-glyceraldehyde reductase